MQRMFAYLFFSYKRISQKCVKDILKNMSKLLHANNFSKR